LLDSIILPSPDDPPPAVKTRPVEKRAGKPKPEAAEDQPAQAAFDEELAFDD
jgi:hypothetical protein